MMKLNRRKFVNIAAATAAGSVLLPKYSIGAVGQGDVIKVGILGVGVRGSGAFLEALKADNNTKIVAIGDIFQDKIDAFLKRLESQQYKEFSSRIDLPKQNIFVGVDALEQLLQTDVDVVILTTPPAFRPYEMKKCIDANKHVFAEKPIAVDACGARFIQEVVIPLARKKGLSLACGTQGRHLSQFVEAIDRLRDGQIGNIVNVQSYYYCPMYLEGWSNPPDTVTPEDMEYQIRRWLAFYWISGDQYVEQHIHTIDIANWILGEAEPLQVLGSAGRDATLIFPQQGNRASHFAVDYTMANDIHHNSFCRQEKNTSSSEYKITVFGTKGTLKMSLTGKVLMTGEKPWICENLMTNNEGQIAKQKVLYQALRKGQYLDNVSTLLNSNWIAIAGREAAYAGKTFKYQWIKRSKQDFLPEGKFNLGKRPIEPVPSPSTYVLS